MVICLGLRRRFKFKRFIQQGILIIILFFIGCSPTRVSIPHPFEIAAPRPMKGNSGLYMCPFTRDEVFAEWTDKAIKAKLGASVGKQAGVYAGQKALEQVPVMGGIVVGVLGEMVGRKIAIEMAGGMEYIRDTSDLSFNSLDDLAVYMYVRFSNNEHYQEALNILREIYPELTTERYINALRNAKRGG